MTEPLVSRLLRIALYIIFALGILCTLTLPVMLDYYTGYFYDAYYLEPGYRSFILTFLIITAIPSLWTVLEMIWMLRSVPHGPFVIRNVRALCRVGTLLFFLAAAFFFKCILYVTFLTMLCGLLFVVCGLFALTLSSLFRQAIAFKEENDLTI